MYDPVQGIPSSSTQRSKLITTPFSPPFIISEVFTFNFLFAAAKKRSNRAQNDYEMMGTLPRDRNNTLTTLPSNSVGNKNAIIDIPDEKLPEVITRLKNAPVEAKDDVPPKDDACLPVKDSRTAVPATEGSEENSLILHTEARDTNQLTREGSPQGPKSDEELVPRYKFSIDGMTNHINDQIPEQTDPSFKELNKESEAARLTPKERSCSSSSSDSEEESILESFTELDSEVNAEEVNCVLEEAPLEGAPSSSSSEETASPGSAKVNCLISLLQNAPCFLYMFYFIYLFFTILWSHQ